MRIAGIDNHVDIRVHLDTGQEKEHAEDHDRGRPSERQPLWRLEVSQHRRHGIRSTVDIPNPSF